MKKGLLLLIISTLIVSFSKAQCPYITGALIDAANVGLPAGEGKSEFMAFTTGTSALPVNGFSVGYGTTTAATGFTIDGATITWQTLSSSPAITNSAGTITNITSGSIPANTPVVILNSANTVDYDLATFGPNVYVLVYSSTGTGVSGFTASGNFANKSAPAGLRYFRVTAGACNNVVSYDKNATAFSSADGAGAKWNSLGVISYVNTGSSGAVLPINLLNFKVAVAAQKTVISWSTSSFSTANYFELQKSIDGIAFSSIALVNAKESNAEFTQRYTFTDPQLDNQVAYYRLKITDKEGIVSFSSVAKLDISSLPNQPISVYPNPAQDKLFLESNMPVKSVRIRDFYGKNFPLTIPNTSLAAIDISSLPSGLYILQIETDTGMEYLRFVKE